MVKIERKYTKVYKEISKFAEDYKDRNTTNADLGFIMKVSMRKSKHEKFIRWYFKKETGVEISDALAKYL